MRLLSSFAPIKNPRNSQKALICQDYAAHEPYAILRKVPSDDAVATKLEKGTRRLMRTHDRFWKLFTSTGSIYAYLMYRQINQSPASS